MKYVTTTPRHIFAPIVRSLRQTTWQSQKLKLKIPKNIFNLQILCDNFLSNANLIACTIETGHSKVSTQKSCLHRFSDAHIVCVLPTISHTTHPVMTSIVVRLLVFMVTVQYMCMWLMVAAAPRPQYDDYGDDSGLLPTYNHLDQSSPHKHNPHLHHHHHRRNNHHSAYYEQHHHATHDSPFYYHKHGHTHLYPPIAVISGWWMCRLLLAVGRCEVGR